MDPAIRSYYTVNPATGETLRNFPILTDDEAEALLARAHQALLTWRRTLLDERARLMLRFAELADAKGPRGGPARRR